MLQVSIYRYNPETDSAPYMQEFQVDTQGRDVMVLDVLHMMKEQDNGLAYRRSCREGVCGSDGMNMNGKNGLACITPLSEVVKGNKLTLRPLPGLPVIRDLVVDMGLFYQQYERIQPYLQNDEPAPAIERVPSPAALRPGLLPSPGPSSWRRRSSPLLPRVGPSAARAPASGHPAYASPRQRRRNARRGRRAAAA